MSHDVAAFLDAWHGGPVFRPEVERCEPDLLAMDLRRLLVAWDRQYRREMPELFVKVDAVRVVSRGRTRQLWKIPKV